jgi:Ca2+-binding RTX toxin-like protein
MEFLLLLFVPLVLGGVLLAGDNDDESDSGSEPEEAVDMVAGTEESDILQGASTNSVIDGDGGSDLIFGNLGDDTIDGGAGTDFIAGGNGDDSILGNDGGDVLAGGAGDDTVSGGAGNDFVTGGAGDDILFGGADRDVLVGSTGSDILYGGTGSDYLDGVTPTSSSPLADPDLRAEFASAINSAHGDDATATDINRFLRDVESDAGDHGTDALYGGFGSDYLFGDNGDTVSGGSGEDFFAVNWVSGNAPVTVTDYSEEDYGLTVYIEETPATDPVFALRDASDGSGAELLVDGEVIAIMTDLAAANLNVGDFSLYYGSGFGPISPVILPAMAA